MPNHKTVIVIVPDTSKLPQALAQNERLMGVCEIQRIASLTNLSTYFDTHPEVDAPVIIIGFASATEVPTEECKKLLEEAKQYRLAIGRPPRKVFGASAHAAFLTKLIECGCDETSSEDQLPFQLMPLLSP